MVPHVPRFGVGPRLQGNTLDPEPVGSDHPVVPVLHLSLAEVDALIQAILSEEGFKLLLVMTDPAAAEALSTEDVPFFLIPGLARGGGVVRQQVGRRHRTPHGLSVLHRQQSSWIERFPLSHPVRKLQPS